MSNDKQLYEDIKKRFSQIYDYDAKVGLNEMTFLNHGVEEADEEQPEAPADGAPADPSMGAAPADPSMGGAPADPSMGAAPADPSMGGAPSDPSMGAAPADGSAEGAAPPEGFNPQDGAAPEITDDGFGDASGEAQPGDEVLDITELTDAEEETQEGIQRVADKFDKVMKALGSFEELLRSNDEKIEDLKAEFERRNPTQVEKLGLQAAKSYPFNVTPDEFWKEKEATSNYSTEPDDNGKEQGQYVITKNDVEGDVNWKGIADSLDNPDFILNPSIDKLLKF